MLAADVGEKEVLLFNTTAGTLQQTLRTEAGGIGLGISWSPDSRKLAYSAGGGTIVIWDVQTGEQIAGWEMDGRMESLAWSPDGRLAYYHIYDIRPDRPDQAAPCSPPSPCRKSGTCAC